MVRFSDMLGGSGEPDDAAAAESPYAALANDTGDPEADALDADADAPAKEPVPMATFESPEAVLDRLTQYATSARVTETVAPEAVEPENVEPETVEPEPETEPEPVPDEPLRPVGDDFLPTSKGIVRRGRGRKRHP